MDKVIEEFILGIKKGPFKYLKEYKGDTASENIAKLNKKIGDIYDCAVYQAWLDMNRTVDGAGKAKKASCEAARKAAAEALRNYFKNEPKSKDNLFDGWYFETCSKIFKPTGLTLGQAQKILNMAFKYLFCCEDIRSKKQNHFTFCHMPLDSFTLNWYKNHCAAAQYSGEKWSQINDPDLYYSIEKEIRDALSDFAPIVKKADYAIPWITALKEAGYHCYFLSNFSKIAEKECVDALSFMPLMEGGILSWKDTGIFWERKRKSTYRYRF